MDKTLYIKRFVKLPSRVIKSLQNEARRSKKSFDFVVAKVLNEALDSINEPGDPDDELKELWLTLPDSLAARLGGESVEQCMSPSRLICTILSSRCCRKQKGK